MTTAPNSSSPRGTFACVRALGSGQPVTPAEILLLVKSQLARRTTPGGAVVLTKKGLRLFGQLQGAETRTHELRLRAKADARRAFVNTLPYRDRSFDAPSSLSNPHLKTGAD